MGPCPARRPVRLLRHAVPARGGRQLVRRDVGGRRPCRRARPGRADGAAHPPHRPDGRMSNRPTGPGWTATWRRRCTARPTCMCCASPACPTGTPRALYDRVVDPASWTPTPTHRRGVDNAARARGETAVVSNIAFDLRPAFRRAGMVDEFLLSYEVRARSKPDPGSSTPRWTGWASPPGTRSWSATAGRRRRRPARWHRDFILVDPAAHRSAAAGADRRAPGVGPLCPAVHERLSEGCGAYATVQACPIAMCCGALSCGIA